jgi:hypothetical protein
MAGKKWIKAAVSNAHGQFRAKAERAGESTREFAEEHKGDGGKTGKQANLALTLMGMHNDHASKLYGKKRVRSG